MTDRPAPSSGRLVAAGLDGGLSAVGVCSAEPFEEVREVLEQRRDAGLHGGMSFTYRNPSRSTDPRRTLPGARSLVVGALRYRTDVPAQPDGHHGRVARYATADHYRELRAALGAIARELEEAGFRSVVLADDNALVDRAAAVRAGLGWYGKSSNVLLPGRGSWFVLGAVVTTAPLDPTGDELADGCGGCTRCLEGCPTAAIVAPGVVDARRCLAWLLQKEGEFPAAFREALGDRVYGCDECQEVCPPSRREAAVAPGTADPAHAAGDAAREPAPPVPVVLTSRSGAWVDLLWMLDATDDELMRRCGRWYVPRREPRYLRRNALVALGNSLALRGGADARAAEVDAILGRYLDGGDDLLAAHAAWAALRGGRRVLLEADERAARPAVASEVAGWRTELQAGETER